VSIHCKKIAHEKHVDSKINCLSSHLDDNKLQNFHKSLSLKKFFMLLSKPGS